MPEILAFAVVCVRCQQQFPTFMAMHEHLQDAHPRPLDPARTGDWQVQPPATPFQPPNWHRQGRQHALNGAQP